jgi:hypothetical protein
LGGVKECQLHDSDSQPPTPKRSRFPWAEAFFGYPDLWPVYLIGTAIFIAAIVAPFVIASRTSNGWLLLLSLLLVVGGGAAVIRDALRRRIGIPSYIAVGLWFGCVLIALFIYADYP